MKCEQFTEIESREWIKHTTAGKTAAVEEDKLYDLSILYEMDDNEYVAEVLAIFLKNTPNELGEMRDAALAKKINAVHRNAHKLKSSAGIIKADSLYMLLEQIEEISREGKYTDELTGTIEKAGVEYNKIQVSLLALLNNLVQVNGAK